jgi:hypothetical protein
MILARSLLFALTLSSTPFQPTIASTDGPTRSSIEATMTSHPHDADVQDAGRRALQALDDWEAVLSNRTQQADPAFVEESAQPSAVQVTGPPAFPNPMAGLDTWDINENYFGGSVAYEDWTINDEFPGAKFELHGRYSFHRSEMDREVADCPCNPPPPAPFRMMGTVAATAQWGEHDLERAYVGVSAYSLQRNFEAIGGGWRPLRDSLELGVVVHGRDDPLGLDSYTEITLARVGRTWGWIPREKPYILFAGFGVSTGYAWADSVSDEYNDVSNPILGGWVTVGISRPGWGKIYVEQRAVNGFQFSSPSAGGSTSREARFRFGLMKKITGCMTLELYIDKRSFNFSDHRLSDLYSKAKRTGAELGCAW